MLHGLKQLQRALQREKLDRFKRRVAFGDLITDRWKNAEEYGFGTGSSSYDNVLILGDVAVGKQTWIGPNVILDGKGGLTIGDNCAISAGVQIYSHDSVQNIVTLGRKPIVYAATVIGDGVYIGPNAVISKGVTIGDGAIIGALSFVNNDIPPGRKAWGCPARIVGDVAEGRHPE